ncbi:MAG: sulfatase [Planctomycetota bacterium]|nr:sulfatase [Planctomycetota bacterium]
MRHLRAILPGSALLVAILLAGCGRSDDGSGPEPTFTADASSPNILVISIDMLRPDHLSCYGHDSPTSPRLDAFAAEGALFEHAISSTSWTLPAHAALFTGLADSVHGCTDTDKRLDPTRHTLAERLNAAGYATAGFFSGPYLHPVFGLAQGFDTYVDCSSYAGRTMKIVAERGTTEGRDLMLASHADITNPTVYENVSAWLAANERRPFFLFIHMWDVHFDFIPPPPYDTMFDPDYDGVVDGRNFFFSERINPDMAPRDLEHVLALYDGEIAWTDMHVGKILDDLEALGLADSTLVIILSDHGTEFFEHNNKGHRQTLYEEVIRIPMMVRFPGVIEPGQRFSEQARIIDVLPTVLDFAGAPAPGDVMGQSLRPLLSGGTLPRDNLAISELYSIGIELRSFRRNERKMLEDELNDNIYLFDLVEDPGEENPLRDAGAPLQWVRDMLDDARLGRQWLREFRASMPQATATSDIPEDLRRQLESLGYLGGEDEE